MITRIALTPYRLPLRRPWRSARGEDGARDGWLVGCEDGGLTGYGDCAPMPRAGTEDRATAWRWLLGWRVRALGQPLEAAVAALDALGERAPSARHAAECALADIAAQGMGLPLASWLSPELKMPDSLAVPVNAALGALGEVTPAHLSASAAEGCRVVKVKMGLGGLEAELNRLRSLAAHLPDGGRFRLDANGAWTRSQASRAVAVLNALPVEALEEPLKEPDLAGLGELQRQAEFPLALDESLSPWLHRLGLARPGLDRLGPGRLPVRRLVLKPAVLGGLRRTLTLARAAAAAGQEVVVTSLIESAAGLWPTLHLAAAIASAVPQGLATSAWLVRDLGEPPRVKAGCMAVPSTPGSGFRPR